MRYCAKVLVVGGGPSGSTAARLLAENNVDNILLERNLFFIKPCGGGIPSTAFEELRIPKTAIKREVKSIKIVSPTDKSIDIELKGGSIAIVQRGEFDHMLREKAEEKGSLILNGEFTGFVHDRHFTVEAVINGVKSKIVTEYIIAADGVNSKARKIVIDDPSGYLYTASELIDRRATNICEFWFGSYHAPNFYSWIFPAANGTNLGTGALEPRLIKVYLDRFKIRRGILQKGQGRVYRIPLWEGNIYNKGRILFTGDAAGQVLPLAYEGIYYAMKSGEFAATAIIEQKVKNYKKLWEARFKTHFKLMGKLKNYFLKDDKSVEKLINLHRKPEVQEASMRLWLTKDKSKGSLLKYMKLFGKFLG